MNVAIYSESPADEAAIRILVDAILGTATNVVEHIRIRPSGWPSVVQALPGIVAHLCFHRPDADGLVVVADSDNSPVHREPAGPDVPCNLRCRLCEIHQTLAREIARIGATAPRSPLKTAVGVASPAIEAWLLAGMGVHVTESAWSRGIETGQFAFTKQELKQKLYGTTRPSLRLETERMVEAAHRVAKDLPMLERIYPSGFGALSRSLRAW